MKRIFYSLLAIVALAGLSSCQSAPVQKATSSSAPILKSEADFITALEQAGMPVSDKSLEDPEILDLDEALFHCLAAAQMTEYAETFTEEKSRAILDEQRIVPNGDSRLDQQLAAALACGLIDVQWYQGQKDRLLEADDMAYLFEACLRFHYQPSESLGRVENEGIYQALQKAWDEYRIVQGIELLHVVDEAVIQGVVTGYNILDKRDQSNFDPELSLSYGHSDLKHALQLIALMRSEGLDAEVAFQGKTSAFLYLEEWGAPQESESFMVKQIPSGNYVAYSKEYNLIFQFDSREDKEAFNSMILAYAKKDAADEEGLIYASWWQPLYFSDSPMGDGYRKIVDNRIDSKLYTAHPFSLIEHADGVEEGFLEIDPDLNIEAKEFWVNQAFYNYLQGESK